MVERREAAVRTSCPSVLILAHGDPFAHRRRPEQILAPAAGMQGLTGSDGHRSYAVYTILHGLPLEGGNPG